MITQIRNPRSVTTALRRFGAVLALPERLDVHEVARLRHQLRQLELGDGHDLVLDGRAVVHADAAGLDFLVEARTHCDAVATRVTLGHPSLALRLAIELSSTCGAPPQRARRAPAIEYREAA